MKKKRKKEKADTRTGPHLTKPAQNAEVDTPLPVMGIDNGDLNNRIKIPLQRTS